MNEVVDKNLNANLLQMVAQDILQEAKKNGATQAEVSVAESKGFSVSAQNGQVETVEYNQDKVIEVKVYFGKRSGIASLTDIRPEALRAAVEAACHIAKFTSEDPASGLAARDELGFDYPKLDLSFPWDISVTEAIELACQIEKEALALDPRIMSANEVNVGTAQSLHLYANSEGFSGFFPHTQHEMSCVLVAKDKEEMQRDYSYTVAVDPNNLEPVSTIARQAVTRTVDRLGARQLPTMKTPVIFAAEEARSLFGHFLGAIQGSNLYRKATFLLDHLHKQIFPEWMHIQEFPHLPKGLGSAPFDGDGLLTRDNIFVEAGILQSYLLGVYSARKLNMKSTGNAGGTHNLIIRPGNQNLNDLIKTMHKGLLVTELMGQGVNILTGDYSRGVGGFWIENGEIQYPVHEITIAGKLPEMFKQMVAIGNDVDIRGNVRTGSILIENMMVAGA